MDVELGLGPIGKNISDCLPLSGYEIYCLQIEAKYVGVVP